MRSTKTILFLTLLFSAVTMATARTQYVSPCMGPGCRTSGDATVQYKLEYLQGRLWRHSPAIRGLDNDYTRGGEFAVEFPQLGGKGWVYYWRFPTIGAAIQYLNLGNNKYLGDAFTLYPYVYLPLAKTKSQIFSFNLKLGAGVAFITKKYDKASDPMLWDTPQPRDYSTNNYAIGSTANAFVTAGLNFDLRFSKKSSGFWSRLGMLAEFDWNHYSNASIKKPDYGLDALNVGVGLRYIPYLTPCPMRAGLSRLPRKWHFEPELTVGVNRKYETDTKLYPTGTFRIGAYRPLRNTYRMGFSIDAFYNTAFTNDREKPVYYSGKDSETGANASKFRMGISWANELLLGRFTPGLQAGFYLINKQVEHDGHFYFRLSTKYEVYNNLYVVAALKSNMKEMESLEIGLGYSLYKKDKAPYSWLPEKPEKTKMSKTEKEELKITKQSYDVPMAKQAKKHK